VQGSVVGGNDAGLENQLIFVVHFLESRHIRAYQWCNSPNWAAIAQTMPNQISRARAGHLVMDQLPYIQPFEDVNKQVSGLWPMFRSSARAFASRQTNKTE
jgi:hypothetical protein